MASELKVADNQTFPYQVIYFGSPGTGKSHHIKENVLKDVDERFIFRTTFHPDSDYSSFVGTYKPVSLKTFRPTGNVMTRQELANELKRWYEESDVKVTALNTFVFRYIDYFNGVIANYNKKDFFAEAGLSETYSAEANKIVNLHRWLDENGYLNADESISYRFVPQVFTDAYVKSWLNPEKDIFLVIEEINRGNCAQIFGDLFQLLDRGEDGFSEYSVNADSALKAHLEERLGSGNGGIRNGRLRLPANLHIVATMNTSDQSLFPMDSAFKRRWEWEYIPIDYSSPESRFVITLGERSYLWTDFLHAVNRRIKEVSESEDKQLGNFFIKNDIGESIFKNKVMFYLWSEICKEEYGHKSFFKDADGKEFSFNDLYSDQEGRSATLLRGFMEYLNVTPISGAATQE
ncbi:MAG TPA: hypothetical protein DDX40_04775 [Rikenellaceae bacterium]|nr:hypothetical protein [Rikenellaceae bacterium]